MTMERLLLVELHAAACEAEAWCNGVAVARADDRRPHVLVPVHEYIVAGGNRLELAGRPLQDGAGARPGSPGVARLRLLLRRAGQPVAPDDGPALAQLRCEVASAPASAAQALDLPIAFPRWRWLDAPPAEAGTAVHQQALALLQDLAGALCGGRSADWLAATRLRTGELALAYQQDAADCERDQQRRLQRLHAGGAPAFAALDAARLRLRALAGGRLLECLDAATGEPFLRTLPDAFGQARHFPLRLAAVQGRLHVLR